MSLPVQLNSEPLVMAAMYAPGLRELALKRSIRTSRALAAPRISNVTVLASSFDKAAFTEAGHMRIRHRFLEEKASPPHDWSPLPETLVNGFAVRHAASR